MMGISLPINRLMTIPPIWETNPSFDRDKYGTTTDWIICPGLVTNTTWGFNNPKNNQMCKVGNMGVMCYISIIGRAVENKERASQQVNPHGPENYESGPTKDKHNLESRL